MILYGDPVCQVCDQNHDVEFMLNMGGGTHVHCYEGMIKPRRFNKGRKCAICGKEESINFEATALKTSDRVHDMEEMPM